MMRKLFSLVLTLALLSCQGTSNKNQFRLTGQTNGIADNTYLYLEDSDSQMLLDSVQVIDNRFVFQTKIEQLPISAILHTQDFEHYRYLWIEDKEMTFDASVSTFRYAPIKGSALNDLAQELANAQKGTSRPEQLQLEAEFIKEHPESIISARTLSIYASTWGKSKTSVLFENFSAENKETHYGKKISKYLKYAQELKVGDRFVDFTMNDPDGNSIAFSEVHGKYILLEFWSSHCGPCRVENPTLVQTYQKYQPKGFEIVGVSLDKQMAHWTKAIEEDQLPWTQVSDLNGRDNIAALIYDISGIPDNFLIDQQGIIIDRNLRGEKLNARLQALFNQ